MAANLFNKAALLKAVFEPAEQVHAMLVLDRASNLFAGELDIVLPDALFKEAEKAKKSDKDRSRDP